MEVKEARYFSKPPIGYHLYMTLEKHTLMEIMGKLESVSVKMEQEVKIFMLQSQLELKSMKFNQFFRI